jgi:hypothetical protein
MYNAGAQITAAGVALHIIMQQAHSCSIPCSVQHTVILPFIWRDSCSMSLVVHHL